jgi:transglutaminase-like putative cysteine protease
MAVRIALKHKTSYHYDRNVEMGPQVIRLRPAPHNRTPVHKYSLTIEPKEHFINWQQDPPGNYLARVVVNRRTPVFSVTVDLVVDLEAYSPFDFFLEPSADEYPFRYDPALAEELLPYLEIGESSPVLDAFGESFDRLEQAVGHPTHGARTHPHHHGHGQLLYGAGQNAA